MHLTPPVPETAVVLRGLLERGMCKAGSCFVEQPQKYGSRGFFWVFGLEVSSYVGVTHLIYTLAFSGLLEKNGKNKYEAYF